MERALARSRDRFPDPRNTGRKIRLMIVDDSTVARAVLSRMVESDPAFEITAVAGTAEDAIEASADQLMLTGSGTQATDLVCRFLLRPGDTVLFKGSRGARVERVLQGLRGEVRT